jgi:hypothetical protein
VAGDNSDGLITTVLPKIYCKFTLKSKDSPAATIVIRGKKTMSSG